MIGILVTRLGPRRSIRARLLDLRTPREMGHIVRDLQQARVRNLHANANQCIGCALAAQMVHGKAITALPNRFKRDKDWWHRHVEMPAARKYARMLDGEMDR